MSTLYFWAIWCCIYRQKKRVFLLKTRTFLSDAKLLNGSVCMDEHYEVQACSLTMCLSLPLSLSLSTHSFSSPFHCLTISISPFPLSAFSTTNDIRQDLFFSPHFLTLFSPHFPTLDTICSLPSGSHRCDRSSVVAWFGFCGFCRLNVSTLSLFARNLLSDCFLCFLIVSHIYVVHWLVLRENYPPPLGQYLHHNVHMAMVFSVLMAAI